MDEEKVDLGGKVSLSGRMEIGFPWFRSISLPWHFDVNFLFFFSHCAQRSPWPKPGLAGSTVGLEAAEITCILAISTRDKHAGAMFD